MSTLWRQQFIRTYLERDLSELGIQLPATTMRRFWAMLAHYHGEIWNGSELARAFGVSQKTVRGYLDTLCATSSPRVTPSMRSALEALGLEELVVIHAGAESYPLTPRIRAVGLARMRQDVPALG